MSIRSKLRELMQATYARNSGIGATLSPDVLRHGGLAIVHLIQGRLPELADQYLGQLSESRLGVSSEAGQAMHDALGVLIHSVEIDAGGRPTQAHTSLDEGVFVDAPVLGVGREKQHIEEVLRIRNVEAEDPETCAQRAVPQLSTEVIERDDAIAVWVELVIQSAQLLVRFELFSTVLHCERISVGLRKLHRLIYKDRRQDVQKRDLAEGDEEDEKQLVHVPRQADDKVDLRPIVSPRARTIQSQHGAFHGAKVTQHALHIVRGHVIPVEVQLNGGALYEDQSEDVKYQQQHDDAPHKACDRTCQGIQDHAQLCEKLHHTKSSEQLPHLQNPQNSHECDICSLPTRGAERREQQVGNRECHEHHVEDVPPHVGIAEEKVPMHQQL
mmetsp:Transcript_89500/g.258139  ORF Transcript_89500/g.258139 Transcript_89500/m.258139 type:complete len:385 (-) Transcript_89500:225-1379(-)